MNGGSVNEEKMATNAVELSITGKGEGNPMMIFSWKAQFTNPDLFDVNFSCLRPDFKVFNYDSK